MKLKPGLWYYNKQQDTFLQCRNFRGKITVQTFSRVSETEYNVYQEEDDRICIKDIPETMTRGYRPFGKLKGRGSIVRDNGKTFLIIPRIELFRKRIMEQLPNGFDEKVFKQLAYEFPDMIV